MTSGVFRSIEIAAVTINRDERQRRELTNLDELAESLKLNGLIEPILVTRDELVLIAGERRIAAAKLLGWTHIAAQFQDEIEPAKLRILELEENIRRVDLPWQDRVRATEDYHSAQVAINPEWTLEQSAEQLGVKQNDVVEKLRIAKEMKVNPEVAKMERYSIARNFVTRQNERKATLEEKLLAPEAPKVAQRIINADFIEWAKTYEGPKFNLIHCDFPYGVNMQNSAQAAAARAGQGDYNDTEDVYWLLIEALALYGPKFIDDQAHLVFWFSMKFYTPTVAKLREAGWKIDDFPLIWHKSDSVGIIPDPQRGGRRVYETALFGSRGDRKIVRAVDNGVSLPKGQTIHLSEKPVPVLTHFFKMLVDGSTSLLDPTAGSGSALRAADALGASRVFGIERDAEFAEKANAALEKPSVKLEEIKVD